MKKLIVFFAVSVIAVSAAAQTGSQKKPTKNTNTVPAKKTPETDTTSKKKQPTGFNVKAIQQEQNNPPGNQSASGQNSFLPKPGKEKNTSGGNTLKKVAGPNKN